MTSIRARVEGGGSGPFHAYPIIMTISRRMLPIVHLIFSNLKGWLRGCQSRRFLATSSGLPERIHVPTPGFFFGLSDPDAIVNCYPELGCGIVGLTLGSEGVMIATRNRRERIAPHAIKAIDATAAGDPFDGAFLADYVPIRNPFEAARYANAAAALAASRPRRGEFDPDPCPD
jgi:sugar/nucleoside kinase (ribokinase family)